MDSFPGAGGGMMGFGGTQGNPIPQPPPAKPQLPHEHQAVLQAFQNLLKHFRPPAPPAPPAPGMPIGPQHADNTGQQPPYQVPGNIPSLEEY